MKRCLLIVVLLGSVYAQEPGCHEGGHNDESALDIGGINDRPVSGYPKDPEIVRALKATFASFHKPGEKPPCEYYAPDGLYRNGKRIHDKKLQKEHRDHVHIHMCT